MPVAASWPGVLVLPQTFLPSLRLALHAHLNADCVPPLCTWPLQMNIFEPYMQSTSNTVKMLATTSSLERLQYCREMLSTFRSHSACVVQ